MKSRESLKIRELQYLLAERQNGKCFVCGGPLTTGNIQLAHRIPQTRLNLQHFGKEVIHHEKNMRAVCSLACNKQVEVGRYQNPRYDGVIDEIRQAQGEKNGFSR